MWVSSLLLFYAEAGWRTTIEPPQVRRHMPLRLQCRYLPFVLAVAAASCGCNIGSGNAPSEPESPASSFSADEVIVAAADKLMAAHVPGAPLAPGVTRRQRSDYLLATEEALRLLKGLANAGPPRHVVSGFLEDRGSTQRIIGIGSLLAVELADAIDREDTRRAFETVRLAYTYADCASSEGVADWEAAGAVSDCLVRGLKSLGTFLDAKFSAVLRQAVLEAGRGGPDPVAVIKLEVTRISSWQAATERVGDVRVEQLLRSVGSARRPSPALVNALRRFAANGTISKDLISAESRLAAAVCERYAMGHGRVALAIPEAEKHPLAALYLEQIRPSIEAAPYLAQLREENLRMMALSVRLMEADPPNDLSAFGEDAISPVSGMKFGYRKLGGGFELIRPRKLEKT
jgi:hypothetical protein